MKENQTEIFQKYLWLKNYEWHKKSSRAHLIDACAAAKHKIILLWP